MKKAAAGIKLIRPVNGMVAALSLVAAQAVAFGTLELPREAALSVFFLVSFGYAINDIFDMRTDAINRPGRALPSGVISRNEAWMITLVMLAAGFVAAIPGGWILTLYYLIVAACLFGYATGVSGVLAVANVLVALLCSSVFALIAVIGNGQDPGWSSVAAATVLTFLYNLVREIIKDIQDVPGDRAAGRDTLAIRFGATRARLIAAICAFAMIVISYSGWAEVLRSEAYLWIVSFGVNLPLAVIFVIYFRTEAIAGAARVSLVLKVLMLPALAALILGSVK